MYQLILSVSIFSMLLSCNKSDSPQVSTSPDKWETPTLQFVKHSENSYQGIAVTNDFSTTIQQNDKFKFLFKDNSEDSQKLIKNVSVAAKCSNTSEMKEDLISETLDLGKTSLIYGKDLWPAQAILENRPHIYCAWTFTISNHLGSTKTYKLPTLYLKNSPNSSWVKILTRDQAELQKDKVVDISQVNRVHFSSPETDQEYVSLNCDLLKIKGRSLRVAELLNEVSTDENLRKRHPTQRCFVEMKSSSGRVYRSSSYYFYLHHKPSSEISIDYAPIFTGEIEPLLLVANVKLKNFSDQPKHFAVYNQGVVRVDILFIDSAEPTNPLSSVRFHVLKGSSLDVDGENLKRVVINGKKAILLEGHEEAEVRMVLNYEFRRECNRGEAFTWGGIIMRLGPEMIYEHTSYLDQMGKVVEVTTHPGTKVSNQSFNVNSPIKSTERNFFKLIDDRLSHPPLFLRNFVEVDAGC